MTKDPVKRSANNARYYENRKAKRQGQQNNNSSEDSQGSGNPLDIFSQM
jgi:hypothetical protein